MAQVPSHTHTFTFDIPSASSAEVAAGTSDSKAVTPLALAGAGETFLGLLGGGAAGIDVFQSVTPADARTVLELGTASTSATGDFATAAQGTLADTAVQPADLATVATTGQYTDIVGIPTLGTAAAEDATAFATSAQGLLADSAVQPGDGEAVPAGGTTGQVLAKASATDGDTFWTIAGQGDLISTNNGSDFADAAATLANLGGMASATYDPNSVAGDAFDSGNHSGFTAGDVAGKTIPANVDEIRTNGYAAPGDGGDAIYVRQASVPAHGGYRLDDTGQVFAITKRTVRASQFGAFPSETVTSHAELNAALAYLEEVGGGCLEIDKDERYLIDGLVSLINFRNRVRIENVAGGILKAAAGLGSPGVLRFGEDTDGTVTSASVILEDVTIDISEGAHDLTSASLGCNGLSLRWLDYYELNNLRVIGGYDALVGKTTTGGDSGLGTAGCRYGVVNNPQMERTQDSAIYPSWDNSGTIDGYIEVNGGFFYRCHAAFAGKRNLKEAHIRGGLYLENESCIQTAWVNNGGWVDPCRNISVEGAVFRKTLANVVTLRGDGRAKLSDNVVEDVGYLYDGSGNVAGNARAFQFQGPDSITATGNRFEMKEWSPVAEYAYFFGNDTIDGKLGGNHHIRGTTLVNWTNYSVGGSDGLPSRHEGETFINAPVDSSRFVDVHPDSLFKYKHDQEPFDTIYTGGQTFRSGPVAAPVDIDLSALGVMAAGSKSALQTVSVPGLTVDDTVILQPLGAMVDFPEIRMSARAVPDAIQYRTFVGGSASFDFTGRIVRASSERVK